MVHKVKTIEGLARKFGKKHFLYAAAFYTCHLKSTVTDTIYELSSRWFDKMGGILESDKMLSDYNNGYIDNI